MSVDKCSVACNRIVVNNLFYPNPVICIFPPNNFKIEQTKNHEYIGAHLPNLMPIGIGGRKLFQGENFNSVHFLLKSLLSHWIASCCCCCFCLKLGAFAESHFRFNINSIQVTLSPWKIFFSSSSVLMNWNINESLHFPECSEWFLLMNYPNQIRQTL